MNFFGHLVAASWVEPSAQFGLGAMLPDLLPMCGARLRDPIHATVAAGIEYHHRTDAAFHERPAFVELTRDARHWLLDHGVARGPALGAAHVGVELLLDGSLVEHDAGRFAAALDVDLEWQGPIDAARFFQLRHGLLSAGVPATYADPSALATRLIRILGRRPRLRLDAAGERAVQHFADAFAPRVAELAPQILIELRAELTGA